MLAGALLRIRRTLTARLLKPGDHRKDAALMDRWDLLRVYGRTTVVPVPEKADRTRVIPGPKYAACRSQLNSVCR